MMEMRRLRNVSLVIAIVLMMSTVYLALFFAPLPQTSVKSADQILASVEGSRIKVAGFVSSINSYTRTADFEMMNLSLADFSDWQPYKEAASGGRLGTDWWRSRPIDVAINVRSPLEPNYLGGLIGAGANISVDALVVGSVVGPNSQVTGYSLKVTQASHVEVAASPGQFGIMTAPVAQKIFYFHMPSAWSCYLAFGVTLVASVLYLRTRNLKYDRWAHGSAELGVLFATIALLTGPIWAKQEWGVYWRWDDTKLVTTFILWLVYIGYLSLRAAVSDQGTRARVGAVYGILGFVTVPMSFLSARIAPLMASSHPEVIATKSGSLSPEAGMTIGIAVLAFTFLYITMLIKRVEIAESEEELEELKRKVGGEE